MTRSLRIEEAPGGKALKDFIEVPYLVQGDNPNWVPPLRVQAREMFDEKKNPFYSHAVMRRFVCYVNGRPAGRIAAIHDDLHNETHGEKACLFGHFECIQDQEIARALFDRVQQAAKEWGAEIIRGPFNPSINEDVGFLLEPYDKPPMIMMPYNPPYYPEFVESFGYAKSMDLYCYRVEHGDATEKLMRGARAIRKRSKLRFRTMSKKNFWADAMKVWEVYNSAWEKNWMAVPYTEEEFKHLAKNLKSVVDTSQVFFAEEPETDRLVGFSLALPNINEALIKIRDGKLFPFGLPKLLWHTRKRAIKSVRIIIMGVIEEYRGRGVDAVFYADHFEQGPANGYFEGEMGWILESNTMMNRAATMMGGVRSKVYRMYEKAV